MADHAMAALAAADHAMAAAWNMERTYRAYVTGAAGAALLGPRIAWIAWRISRMR
jgi:hypothetical protein